jgi:hypothetical protein
MALRLTIDSASNRNEYQRILVGGKGRQAKVWQLNCRLWADWLEDVGSSASHNTMGLHGLLQG